MLNFFKKSKKKINTETIVQESEIVKLANATIREHNLMVKIDQLRSDYDHFTIKCHTEEDRLNHLIENKELKIEFALVQSSRSGFSFSTNDGGPIFHGIVFTRDYKTQDLTMTFDRLELIRVFTRAELGALDKLGSKKLIESYSPNALPDDLFYINSNNKLYNLILDKFITLQAAHVNNLKANIDETDEALQRYSLEFSEINKENI